MRVLNIKVNNEIKLMNKYCLNEIQLHFCSYVDKHLR